ncbi:hypothetical protein [Fluviicola sp.]|uniref:hypothetical protein n=1 Tax=Fluviicola sp. TaxID=1917219 RepID=UPI003D281F40
MKKNAILKVFLFSGTFLLVLAGCKNDEKKDNAALENPPTNKGVVYKDTVSLLTAQNHIRNYLNGCDSLFQDKIPIRSYSINKSDIFGILGVTSVPNCTYDHCRVYIGLTAEYKFKLYMTPTVLKVTRNSNGSIDSTYVDFILYDSVNKRSFVYDLNAPCPSTCDKTSPLFTLLVR